MSYHIIVVSCWYQRLVCIRLEAEDSRLEGDNLTDKDNSYWKNILYRAADHRQGNTGGNVTINFLVSARKCPTGNLESYYLKYCPWEQFDIHDFFFEGEFSFV